MSEFESIIKAQLEGAAETLFRPVRAASSAEALEATNRAGARRRRRRNAPLIAAVVVLAGGAIAAAATGLLTGSPVPNPAGAPVPYAGYGVPVAADSKLLSLRVADPEGGPPWGMRIVRTTRGLVCAQVGRVYRGQLGQLGIDGVFHNDGRFHLLGSDVLFGTSEAEIQCVLPSQSFLSQNPSADRSGDPVPSEGVRPPTRELRSISYGLLGPHATSVTYTTSSGLLTTPVSPGMGAYLIVQPVAQAGLQFSHGSTTIGPPSKRGFAPPPLDLGLGRDANTIAAVTYRLGSLTCAIGSGAPARTPCPTSRPPLPLPRTGAQNLHEPLHLKLVKDTPRACRAAFLNDPCYQVLLEFRAPYAVTSAAHEYSVETRADCSNKPVASWSLERDVKRGETAKELSNSSFSPSACSATETLQVRFQPTYLAEARSGQRPVIVATASLRNASR